RLRQEEVRQKTIRALLKKRVSEQEVAKDWESGLSEPTLQMASELKRYIQNGIPFKINERLQAVTQIEESIKKKDTSLPGGMARLWQIAEDEIRLSREVALHRQSIQLRGEYLLAEVVRVGMTLLYFKTNQGEYGMALQSGNTWSYEVLGRAEDQNALTTLFASLKKQIRKGYFSLPMPALNVAQRSAK
ncbi:DUF3450 family protein, partial [Myxococcota bacterium]|nr:DUF3450 family protein [Myxococcota bacterium]